MNWRSAAASGDLWRPSFQKTVSATCDQPDDPTLLRFCDQARAGFLADRLRLNIAPDAVRGVSGERGSRALPGPAGSIRNWLLSRNNEAMRRTASPCTARCLVLPTCDRVRPLRSR